MPATLQASRRAAPDLAPETPCTHCGLPVGTHPIRGREDGVAFCCTGCSVVYAALDAAGFGGTYYKLRDLAPTRKAERPAEADPLQLGELDTDAFLDAHTKPAGEGLRSVELFLDGVHCAACVWLVERLPFELDGVTAARLDLPRARLALTFDPATVRLSDIGRWLSRFGYAARPMRSEHAAQRTDAERRLLVRLGVTWALAGNVMLLAFALYSGLDGETSALASAARYVSLALAVPAVAYGGAPFFRRAWASLGLAFRARDPRRLHIDTPIALGILVGTGHSAWATVTGTGEVWFDSITVLIAALLTARWLQLRSRRLAGDATERLLALIPSMVRRVHADAVEVVRLDEVRPDDVVEVPAGEVVPVDGIVERGASRLNNAVLTGESRPEPVAEGDAVEAGATNLSSPIRVRVEAAGDATRVGRLLAWVREQEGGEARVVLLADRISGYFALAVLTLAAVTAVLWAWLDPGAMPQHVVALLVITCPCALGMATPLAMAVAAGRAARAGIFIKSDEATQRLTDVDTIVLDKTGTLTEGRMSLVDFVGDEDALDYAAALEAHSNHPIATAIVQARGCAAGLRGGPEDDGFHVDDFQATAGQGVCGVVGDRYVTVGRFDCVAERSVSADARFTEAVAAFAARGHTPVAVAVDGIVVAVLAVGDAVRDEAAETVARWQRRGYRVLLSSGDHPAVAAAVAAEVGIAPGDAHGGVSPEGKRAFVEALQADGRTVLMVGDGVNDAAALRAADVGVAVGGGSTASLVAADVFMTRPGLAPLADALRGSARTLGVVRRNLGLSLVYNVGGAALAVAGLVTPLVAAVAMPVSSLVVVASSILQRSFTANRTPPWPEQRQATGGSGEELRETSLRVIPSAAEEPRRARRSPSLMSNAVPGEILRQAQDDTETLLDRATTDQ
ncbi:MAG: heavy metal translocating P-type ATPase [Rhodothermales bacterium]